MHFTTNTLVLRISTLLVFMLLWGVNLPSAFSQTTYCYYNDQPSGNINQCPSVGWAYPGSYTVVDEDCVLGGPRVGGLVSTDVRPGTTLRCDDYTKDLYERPTSQSGTDYFFQYDIKETAIGQDATWFYYAINLNGTTGAGLLDGRYGYEIDFDDDGRGDFFVLVTNPSFQQIRSFWTQKDVLMWHDTNNDVGGISPTTPNDKYGSQNGYELEFFKIGEKLPAGTAFPYSNTAPYGGPNLYARINPTVTTVVELAIRKSFVGNPATAGNLRGWATKGNQAPGQFYFHDWYTNAQVGDAYAGDANYPPQNFYEGDNSHGINEGLLPVELTAFDVLLDGDEAILRWATASETNNSGFYIELAPASARRFNTHGFVEGHGTTELAKSYNYRIAGLEPGNYTFRLKQVDYDGTFEYSPEVEVAVAMVERFLVEPAYPNPFNPETHFRFAVQHQQNVRVALYDMLGRQVKVLFEGKPAAHTLQTVRIDGNGLTSGVYLVRIVGENFHQTQRVALVK